jgi:hypothetical protein
MFRYLSLSITLVIVSLFLPACTVTPILGWTYVPSEGSIWGLTVGDTDDEGFIIGGGYDSQYNMYALKLTGSGVYDWDKVYSNLSSGGSHSELWRHEARGLLQTDDGGYIMLGAGKIEGDGLDDKNYLLVKTDASGDIVWSKTYAPDNPYDTGNICCCNKPYALDITDDGGYLAVGSSYVGGYNLASILKTDADGNVDVCKVINDNAKAYDQDIIAGQQTSDGGYLLSGYSDNGSPHGYLALLIKLDADANLEFSKTYQYVPKNHGAAAYAVTQTEDEGYVIGGQLINDITKVLTHGFWMAKLDGDGDMVWEKSIEDGTTIGYPKTIVETPQGDLLTAGEKSGTMALSKFTAGGVLLWNFILPDTLPAATGNDLTLTKDGGCVVVGSGINSSTVIAKINNVFALE